MPIREERENSMELEVGAILDGKVTGITNFGAFVSLPGGRSGLVHISEIAYSYVSDVSSFLQVGQDVKVKLMSVDDNGRINLSIKRTQPQPARPAHSGQRDSAGRGGAPRSGGGRMSAGASRGGYRTGGQSREPSSFEDKLKQYLSESESRLSDLNRGGESRRPRRNRRG